MQSPGATSQARSSLVLLVHKKVNRNWNSTDLFAWKLLRALATNLRRCSGSRTPEERWPVFGQV